VKKSGVIFVEHNPSLKGLFEALINHRLYFLIFFLVLFFTLLLPGENYYQILSFDKKRPLSRVDPLSGFLPSEFPVVSGRQVPPATTARAVVVVDVGSGAVLYSRNSEVKMIPASTTKIITSLVSLEAFPLDRVLTVKRLPGGGAMMGLEVGDMVTVENLLYGLLVASGNDAAMVLADNYNGGYNKFVEKMNEKAVELHMEGSHFVNPMGFEGVEHYSTAKDLSLAATYALRNEVFRRIVATPEISVSNSTFNKWYRLENVNKLLGESLGVLGVKTGWTENAGECLVAAAQRNGRQVLTVVLGSEDRFDETQALLDWVFSNYTWQEFN